MKDQSRANLVFRGLVLLIFGFISMLTTDEGLNKLAFIPGLVITVAGASASLFTYFARNNLKNWGLYFAGGLLLMSTGLFIFVKPDVTIEVLFIGFGIWFIYQAAIDLVSLGAWKKGAHQKWWQVGILAVVEAALGIVIMINPLEGNMRDTMFLGAVLLVGGVATLFTAANLRHKDIPTNTKIQN
jgi:uncharacterized membrane protein HdeD (DUF308 family)